MKIDPYKHKEKYFNWKERISNGEIPDISKENSEIIIKYITDMEHGINVATRGVKGSRSFIRLNTLKERMVFAAKQFKTIYGLEDITKINDEQLTIFFAKMRNGSIRRRDGGAYVSISDYVKAFKAFWHWHMKVRKKEGIEILDITNDLDPTNPKPRWVYLDEKQVRKLCDVVKPEYKVLLMFLFDSGIRSPTELINVKISDFFSNFKELQTIDNGNLRVVSMIPGDRKVAGCFNFLTNRNGFKHINFSNIEMFPSDLSRSLDDLFFNKNCFFGGKNVISSLFFSFFIHDFPTSTNNIQSPSQILLKPPQENLGKTSKHL